ncbi:hypothetical protein KH172YL63_36530 [Bacillus sp. KH172YL63]|nr:hypothetical protein KH172YL63_36530 [Bacillus sp. KH172YL63]
MKGIKRNYALLAPCCLPPEKTYIPTHETAFLIAKNEKVQTISTFTIILSPFKRFEYTFIHLLVDYDEICKELNKDVYSKGK